LFICVLEGVLAHMSTIGAAYSHSDFMTSWILNGWRLIVFGPLGTSWKPVERLSFYTIKYQPRRPHQPTVKLFRAVVVVTVVAVVVVVVVKEVMTVAVTVVVEVVVVAAFT
jgi:hypothetical protein